MVLLEDALGFGQIDLVFRALVPGQLGDQLEIRTHHLVFRGLRVRAPQSAQLALDLGPGFGRKLEGVQALLQLLDLGAFVLFTQLFLNRLHLFAQHHLALLLAQLFLHLLLDLLLRLEAHEIALHADEHAAHALGHGKQLEQLLLLARGHVQIEGDEVRERARLLDTLYDLRQRLAGHAATPAQLDRALTQLAIECDHRRLVRLRRLLRIDDPDVGLEHGITLARVRKGLRTLFAVNQYLESARRALHLHHAHDHTHFVQHFGNGLVYVLPLAGREQQAVAIEHFFDCFQRARPAGTDRKRHAGEHDGLPHGEHGHFQSLSHCSSSVESPVPPTRQYPDESRQQGAGILPSAVAFLSRVLLLEMHAARREAGSPRVRA